MNFLKRPNKTGDKITFYYDFGRGKGQRPSTGIFIYAKPQSHIQRNHNKEALALLQTKKSQLIIEKADHRNCLHSITQVQIKFFGLL